MIKLEALVCRFCGLKLEPATVKAAIEQARLQFEETALTPDKKDKLARGLCPKCDAYNAFLTDARRNLRKCEVCGEQYPLHI